MEFQEGFMHQTWKGVLMGTQGLVLMYESRQFDTWYTAEKWYSLKNSIFFAHLFENSLVNIGPSFIMLTNFFFFCYDQCYKCLLSIKGCRMSELYGY